MKTVRVRFAPSPTGRLHVGGARTALFNYLFAQKHQGAFILRVEDTDLERSQTSYLKDQLNDLKWLGLAWDEGPYVKEDGSLGEKGSHSPYRQSRRLSLYKKYAEQLIQNGQAYYCFLTEAQIQAQKQKALQNLKPAGEAGGQKSRLPYRVQSPYRDMSLKQAQQKIAAGEKAAVRFKTPLKNYTFKDMVRGEVSFPSDMVGDFVLVRPSHLPVYNFACAVDDHLMHISHVFRAEEHLANTLRQLMIFEACAWPPPCFGHLSIIQDAKRKKLSKREGSASCSSYKKQGYLPSALVNFLALLGWNPKTTQEIFTLSELIKSFSIEGFKLCPCCFLTKKNWSGSTAAILNKQMMNTYGSC